MKKKSPVDMKRERIKKISRTVIRLKHSLKADAEINDRLPDTIEGFDAHVAAGEVVELSPESLLKELSE